MLEARSILITGASDGIGRSMALEFSKQRRPLALIARRLALLGKASEERLEAGAPQVDSRHRDEPEQQLSHTDAHERRLGGPAFRAGILLGALL